MKDMLLRAGFSVRGIDGAGDEADFEVASAATSREEIGNPVYPPARRKLAENGIGVPGNDLGVSSHQARQMTLADYEHYDMIICMDHITLDRAKRIANGDPDGKVSMLLDHTARKGAEVADPWYTGNFDATWKDVVDGCQALLAQG